MPTSASGWNGMATGIGLEHKLSGNWSVKGEYISVRLDRQETVNSAIIPGTPLTFGFQQTISVFRLGANWKF
jgi:opacity protein-like surface antigen